MGDKKIDPIGELYLYQIIAFCEKFTTEELLQMRDKYRSIINSHPPHTKE